MAPVTRRSVQSQIKYKVTKTSTKVKVVNMNKLMSESICCEPKSARKSLVQKSETRFDSLDDEVAYVLTAFRSCDPSTLPGREKHLDELEEQLRVCCDHKESVSIYIYGSYGHGKTATLKILLDKAYTKDNFVQLYVNCKRLSTAKCVYEEIIARLSPQTKVNPKMVNITRIKKLIDNSKKPVLLVLDEVDELSSSTSLVVLSLFELRARVVPGKLVLIGVGNTQNFIESISILKNDESLTPILMKFGAYSKDEIKSIVSERLNSAPLERLIFSDVALNLLSAKLASSGSARDALGCASAAVRHAVESNIGDDICKVDASAVFAVLNSSNTAEMVNRLVVHDKVVLCSAAIILKTQTCVPGNLTFLTVFNLAKKICTEKVLERLTLTDFYSCCQRIEMGGLFDIKRKEKKGVSKDDKITLKCHENEIIELLQNQTLFSGIIHQYINS